MPRSTCKNSTCVLDTMIPINGFNCVIKVELRNWIPGYGTLSGRYHANRLVVWQIGAKQHVNAGSCGEGSCKSILSK